MFFNDDARDIKLSNFIFESEDERSPLKLIDFGLSKYYQQFEVMNKVLGSPHYIAPEVLKKSYDQTSDLWSVGVLSYILLFNRYPFDCPPASKNQPLSPTSDIFQIILNNEPDYSPKGMKISPVARDFLEGLLEKDPQKRRKLEDVMSHPFLQPADNICERRPSIPLDIVRAFSYFSTLQCVIFTEGVGEIVVALHSVR